MSEASTPDGDRSSSTPGPAPTSAATGLPHKRKAPACDFCKASRVLCLGREGGNLDKGCPRCISKGIICTTTPVKRKKPTRKQHPVSHTGSKYSISTANPTTADWTRLNEDIRSLHSSNTNNSNNKSRIGIFKELKESSIRRLLSDVDNNPAINHPLVIQTPYRHELEKAHYNLDLLNPSTQLLVCCLLALAATVTSDPVILNGSLISGTEHVAHSSSSSSHTGARGLPDHSMTLATTSDDLRAFGYLRAGTCRVLKEHVELMAANARVTTVCSSVNAAICVVLQVLCHGSHGGAGQRARRTRPYANAAYSFLRVLDDEAQFKEGHGLRWISFLMMESTLSVVHDVPIPFSQFEVESWLGPMVPWPIRTLRDPPPPSLAKPNGEQQHPTHFGVVVSTLEPFSKELQSLARRISERVLGYSARRNPLNINEVSSILDALDSLSETLQMVETYSTLSVLSEADKVPMATRISQSLATCWAAVHLPLYREVQRRPETQGSSIHTRVRRATFAAAMKIAQITPGMMELINVGLWELNLLNEWTQILCAEGESAKAMGVDRTGALRSMISSLKQAGWSTVDETGTTATAELQLSLMTSRLSLTTSTVPVLTHNTHSSTTLPLPLQINPLSEVAAAVMREQKGDGAMHGNGESFWEEYLSESGGAGGPESLNATPSPVASGSGSTVPQGYDPAEFHRAEFGFMDHELPSWGTGGTEVISGSGSGSGSEMQL